MRASSLPSHQGRARADAPRAGGLARALGPDDRRRAGGPSTVATHASQQRSFASPPAATVSRNAAATAAARIEGAQVESANLEVTFTPTGTQLLVWRVELSGAAPLTSGSTRTDQVAALVDVDALTGVATVVGAG